MLLKPSSRRKSKILLILYKIFCCLKDNFQTLVYSVEMSINKLIELSVLGLPVFPKVLYEDKDFSV